MKTTDRKEVSINDIHAVLNDISLKTLQRDMNTLIDAGLVKKEGSKRWSRYSLGD
jgi:DNA-binding HxlR family transcriptional regulator